MGARARRNQNAGTACKEDLVMSRFTSIKSMAASFIFVVCLVFSSYSNAETFTVMNLDNSGEGSLRQAIIDANENNNAPGVVDEIVFADGLTGTIMFPELDNELEAQAVEVFTMFISEDVNIIGPGKDVITIDGNNADNIIAIADTEKESVSIDAEAELERIKVSISGLKFINGQTRTIESGGAIFNRGELRVEACEFSNNRAFGFGGAIYNERGAIITEIKDSDFIMNSARVGGAIGILGFPEPPVKLAEEEPEAEKTLATLSGSSFDQNTAEISGGALSTAGEATIGIISGTTFSNNIAMERLGGAIYIDDFTNILEPESVGTQGLEGEQYNLESLTDCEFTNNSAPAGGAIVNNFGSIGLIADCSFIGNSAEIMDPPDPGPKTAAVDPQPNSSVAGGAIVNASGLIVEIARTTFSLNTSQGFGGAIVNAAIVEDSGGGMELIETAAPGMVELERALIMNMNDSTFDENSASISGGALANASGTIEMVNITYSENIAGETGGAIYNRDIVLNPIGSSEEEEVGSKEVGSKELAVDTAPITFVSFTTFARNEAGVEGGAIYEEIIEDEEPKSIHLRHSILALNVGGNCGGLDTKDEGGNHSDDDTCPLLEGNMATIVLGELADNGGPTNTVALLEGDPIDSAVECTAISIFAVIASDLDPFFPVESDQRGAPRAFGEQCDAGAFEFGAVVPGGFFHNPILPALASNFNVINAEEASPEAPVAFLWGLLPGSTIIGGKVCNGIEIGINNPRLLAIEESSAEGIAEHVFFIPLIGDLELVILTQAVDISTCATSEVILDIISKE